MNVNLLQVFFSRFWLHNQNNHTLIAICAELHRTICSVICNEVKCNTCKIILQNNGT